MKRVSKKKAPVKRGKTRKTKPVDRSKAAKKGWATRRKNEKAAKKAAKARKYEGGMQKLIKELKQSKKEQARLQRELKLTKLKVVAETGTMKQLLDELPEAEAAAARYDIIQARMDRALRLYGDVRYDAHVLSEELDMDIGDVYDAWDYDSEAS